MYLQELRNWGIEKLHFGNFLRKFENSELLLLAGILEGEISFITVGA